MRAMVELFTNHGNSFLRDIVIDAFAMLQGLVRLDFASFDSAANQAGRSAEFKFQSSQWNAIPRVAHSSAISRNRVNGSDLVVAPDGRHKIGVLGSCIALSV